MMNLKDFANSYIKQGLYITQVYINTNSEGYKTVNFPKNWLNNLRKTTVQNWSGNIAIATGHGNDCNVCVLDVDSPSHRKDGVNGLESIEKWQKEHGTFPDTRIAETPTGGRHYYFKVPQDIHIKRGSNLLPGVDVQGDKACVIAPPSVYNSKRYKWINNANIADANDSVLELMQHRAMTKKETLPQATQDLAIVPEGGRTDYLVKAIGRHTFKGNMVDDEAIKAMVRSINENKCSPPLSEEELESEVFPSINNFDEYEREDIPKEISLVSMADVQPKPIEWLIPGWIPKGKITLIGADGGTGKTFLWCHIVACLSAGKPCFFEDPIEFSSNPRKPMKFLVLSSEDELEEVLSERLISNGANMNNILSVPYTDPNFEYMKFNSETLKNTILEHRPDGCIFDPLQSFLPPNVNMGYRNQMRDALNPLVALGTETGTTMIIVMHTNKMSDRSGRGRFADSSDIFDIARSAFLLGKTKNGSLYLDHAKSNYAPLNKTVLYMLVDQVPKFLGSTEKKDWDFVHEKKLERSAPARDEAKQMILDLLDEQGEMNIKDLNTALKEAGISDKTIRNAKEDLNSTKKVKLYRKGLGKRKGVEWFISLHEEDKLL